MITKIIYPPFRDAFFNAIDVSDEEIILITPYLQLAPVIMIIEILQKTGNLDKIKLRLITNINSSVFLTKSSDINAILELMQKVPNVEVTGIGNLHAKIYIFDSKRLIITSGNLSLNGIFKNLEVGVEIIDIFEATDLRHKMLAYAKEGTRYQLKDILAIKESLDIHASEHASMFEHIRTQTTLLNRQVKNVTSSKVEIKSTLIANPSITGLISIKGTKKVLQDTSLSKPKDSSPHQPYAASNISILKGDALWDAIYEILLNYRGLHPLYWPMASEIFEKVKIGKWCERQRILHGKHELEPRRQKALRAIGFEFNSAVNEWDHFLQLLNDYREEYPNQWPNTKEVYNGLELGNWSLLQRRYYKQGTLTKRRIERLEEVGFIWDDAEAYWSPTIKLLHEFRKDNPDRWPGPTELYRGYVLHPWLKSVLKKKASLTKAQLKDFTDMDFPIDNYIHDTERVTWFSAYKDLQAYKKQTGSFPAPEEIFNGHHLGQWTQKQQRKLFVNALPLEYKKLITALGLKPLKPDAKSSYIHSPRFAREN